MSAPGPQLADADAALCAVLEALDPVMVPLGFAAGQAGGGDRTAQITYCEPHRAGDGLCADVVVSLERLEDGWRITSVDYDGFVVGEVSRLRLDERAALPVQLRGLAMTIPNDLNR